MTSSDHAIGEQAGDDTSARLANILITNISAPTVLCAARINEGADVTTMIQFSRDTNQG
jgi:hypothetical protein